MTDMKIPFNKPFIVGKEMYYIAQSVLSGHISGEGIFTRKCHTLMQEKFGAKKVMLTTSCTSALEMAALLFNVGSGDEVIMPPFAYVSTANAFYIRGAKPIFVDIRSDTLNIDEAKIEEAVTDRTKVIVPVHYAGVGCEMDAIMQIAKRKNIHVVEDAAHAVNSRHKGKYLGTIGDIGAYSFHETKNIICGEGGAIVVNNDDFIERAEIIREKGTDRSKFFRGEVDKYTWVDMGSSYLPSDLLAAFLYAQLENMDEIDQRRLKIFDYYNDALSPLREKGILETPSIRNSHIFYLLLKDEETRDALMGHLKKRGVLAVFHYLPLHLSRIGRSLGYREGQMPVTESISGRLLRLPFYYEITENEMAEVTDHIASFFSPGK